MPEKPTDPTGPLRAVQDIIGPLARDFEGLREQVRAIVERGGHPGLSEAERRDILAKAMSAKTALDRIERQLAAALRRQPAEVRGHSTVQQLHADIGHVRESLKACGA